MAAGGQGWWGKEPSWPLPCGDSRGMCVLVETVPASDGRRHMTYMHFCQRPFLGFDMVLIITEEVTMGRNWEIHRLCTSYR